MLETVLGILRLTNSNVTLGLYTYYFGQLRWFTCKDWAAYLAILPNLFWAEFSLRHMRGLDQKPAQTLTWLRVIAVVVVFTVVVSALYRFTQPAYEDSAVVSLLAVSYLLFQYTKAYLDKLDHQIAEAVKTRNAEIARLEDEVASLKEKKCDQAVRFLSNLLIPFSAHAQRFVCFEYGLKRIFCSKVGQRYTLLGFSGFRNKTSQF